MDMNTNTIIVIAVIFGVFGGLLGTWLQAMARRNR